MFAIVLITSLVAALLRSAYSDRPTYYKYAELGIDLGAAALALSLTVPVTMFCATERCAADAITAQSIFWLGMVPMFAFAAMQFSNTILSELHKTMEAGFGFLDRTVAVGSLLMGFGALALSSFFVAVRVF